MRKYFNYSHEINIPPLSNITKLDNDCFFRLFEFSIN